MTDYHPLIARAVEGLDRSAGEARRALYERARNALVAQLRSNQPALLEADITKERLALEEAIRKVEAEAARKSRSDPRAEQQTDPRSATPPAGTPEGVYASGAPRRDRSSPPRADLPRARWTAVLPSARERLLRGWSSLKKQGVKGFRNVVGEVHDQARRRNLGTLWDRLSCAVSPGEGARLRNRPGARGKWRCRHRGSSNWARHRSEGSWHCRDAKRAGNRQERGGACGL